MIAQAQDTTQASQLELFARIAVCAPAPHKRKWSRKVKPKAQQWHQLAIEWVHHAVQDDDDPLIKAPIVKRTIKATEAPRMAIAAPASVFDLAGFSVVKKAMMGRKPTETRRRPMQETPHIKVTREDGVTRLTRMHYSETDEWQEREAVRRAKQITPTMPGFKGKKSAKA